MQAKRFIALDEQARGFFFVIDATTGTEAGQSIGTGDHEKSFVDKGRILFAGKTKSHERNNTCAAKKVTRTGKRRKKTVGSS